MTEIIKPYVPILRWRPAEIAAVEKLFPKDRGKITPLIEFIMPAPTIDKETREVKKTPKEKFLETLPNIATSLLKSCGREPVFIDVHLLDSDLRATSFKEILSASSELDLFSIPVTYVIPVTSTNADTETRGIAVTYAKESGHGLCIRIDRSHLEDKDLSRHITEFVEVNKLDINNLDLLVDLRIIDGGTDATDIVSKLSLLPKLKEWRSFIVSGGAFPKDLTNFNSGEVHQLDRLDWKLWNNIRDAITSRTPFFSDYTTQHPVYEYVAAIGSASIRYTDDEKWYIFRGKKPGHIDRKTGIKGPGREQYIGHAQTLVKRDFYKQDTYSFGDTEVSRIASPANTKPGSPTTWLTISINHHLTLAANQTSNSGVDPEAHS
ncbi:MAG: beta family protein [Candidatus Paceibacterota bacterium]